MPRGFKWSLEAIKVDRPCACPHPLVPKTFELGQTANKPRTQPKHQLLATEETLLSDGHSNQLYSAAGAHPIVDTGRQQIASPFSWCNSTYGHWPLASVSQKPGFSKKI